MESKNNKVAFNLGQKQLFLIGDLQVMACKHSLDGNISSWFYSLKAIRQTITGKLSKEELEILKKMENNFAVVDKHFKIYHSQKGYYIMCKLTEEYDNKIKVLMEQYGFNIPTMESSGDKTSREIFGE